MADMFKTWRKATRLAQKRRPISAALALQDLFKPAASARVRKRSKPQPGPQETRPNPGSFITAKHKSRYGVIAYRLYTPVGSSGRRMPLLVMLHGCKQSASSVAIYIEKQRKIDQMCCRLAPGSRWSATPLQNDL